MNLRNLRNPAGVVAMLLTLVLTLSVAGCGSDSSNNDQGSGNKDVAVGGKDFGTADEETAKLGSEQGEGVFPRTVKHSMGSTEIKAKPQRVVVLDTGELDAVLALGITPVGMVTTEGENPVPTYLADRVKGVATVGTIQELNVEAIAALNPDLILGSKLRAEKLYPQLSQIAPTVFSIRPGFPWKENFQLIGAALGMPDEAVKILNEYAKSAKELSSKVPDGATISLVRFMPKKIRLYGNLSLIGVILHDAGLDRPKNQDVNDLAVEISAENIDQGAGDYIFYTSYGKPDATGETSVINGTGWKSLAAVKDGKAHRVNDDVWFLGLGPIGAQQIVKELGEYLAK